MATTSPADSVRSGDPLAAFSRLVEIIVRLRGPAGCAWDREQTPLSLRSSLVEEAWEAVSAIEAGNDGNLAEELGDLYLLVTMLAWMCQEAGSCTLVDVLEGVCAKLVRRHPHVFGEAQPDGVDGILAQWERIKHGEKADRDRADTSPSVLDHLPASLPPLERSFAMQKRAAKAGFDWPDAAPVWDKVLEEIGELRAAAASGDGRKVEEEVGDLLFSVVNLARQLKVDPALALRATDEKFERRLRTVESRLAAQGVALAEAGLQRMDAIWNQLKAEERSTSK